MLIGILSDTHGRVEPAKIAVDLLRARKVEYLIHCGDLGGELILDLLAFDDLPSAFVFGNNDFDHEGLASYAKSIGVTCLHEFGRLELGGKRIAVAHGDNAGLIREIMSDQSADYLCVGHSHVTMDRRAGVVRIINPGALYRTARKTVAVLDTALDRLEFLSIDGVS